MVPPTATYRLQISPEFTFGHAADVCSYLAQLGVSHLFLSPILQAVPGSTHGYDVIDHAALSADAGGRAGFGQLVRAAHASGLKIVADVVPNHMAVPVPENLNAPLWAVLRDGPGSSFAAWFDIDWSTGQVLMPVLGDPVATVVEAGQLVVDDTGTEPVLRYFDHVFPLRDGTSSLPLPELLAAQHYRLAWWRIGAQELNYRRFFDVTTLAGIRVEEAEVFDVTHALLADLVREGALDGLRIDHPDGLADPRGYLVRLARATGASWVVVEKILEGDETLPLDWACAGTTGYDALNVIGGLFVDPAARLELGRLALPPHRVDDERVHDLDSMADELELAMRSAKDEVLRNVLPAEVTRLVDLLTRICAHSLELRDHTRVALRQAVLLLLLEMDRYRAYVVPGEKPPPESIAVIEAAAERARTRLSGPQDRAALDAVADLALDTESGDPERDEFVVRFQQTCGPVMAKGIEDTLFYRWLPLLALNEVGADPHRFGYSPTEFHAYANRLLRDWPATMTTLSTHDTKRSEDARARLYAVSEVPDDWARAVHTWTGAARRLEAGSIDPQAAYLLWQTLVATWTPDGPPTPARITGYLQKALREAKLRTGWTDPDQEYETSAEAVARAVLGDAGLVASISAFVDLLSRGDRANVLGQKLIQLTMPGVPDVYQGCELVDRSLVDPDNRRPVDYAQRLALLNGLARQPVPASLDAEKLLVTTRALQLRREHPEWFGTSSVYAPLPVSTDHAVAFARGSSGTEPQVITVATRLALRLAASGGWGDSTVDLPGPEWTDILTGRDFPDGTTELATLLADLPVALLIRS